MLLLVDVMQDIHMLCTIIAYWSKIAPKKIWKTLDVGQCWNDLGRVNKVSSIYKI